MGPNSWATYYYKHLEQPECHVKKEVFDGVTCNNKVQIRRLAFYGYTPATVLRGQAMKILKYDKADLDIMTNQTWTNYITNKNNYATLNYKEKKDPGDGWAVPFVTGHSYRFHFGQHGTNFENLKIT